MDDLSQRLLRRWVPKWYPAFIEPKTNLFFERLGHSFRPVLTGKRRLLSQFRQLAMYSHAASQAECMFFKPDLAGHLDAITKAYSAQEPGGWFFALDDSGKVIDKTLDLYAHAFVIFGLSHYGRTTGDVSARTRALETLAFIDRNFRASEGFYEALDGEGKKIETPRRHESHMHLLEACLFAHATWGDAVFLEVSDQIVNLFFSRFYDAQSNVLSEYFTDDLKPQADREKSVILCEPGHYCEWIWLLKKHAHAKGNSSMHDDVCLRLLEWVNRFGWDRTHGGIYDELDTEGQVVSGTKRLWPFTEAIKANALMLDCIHDPHREAAKNHMAVMTTLFRDKYMQERGFWTESLSHDLAPATDYMPATSPYHVYFGIMETREILKNRGASKSWRAGPRRLAYASARFLSAIVRETRLKLQKSKAV
ncbi:MAG: N-acylglucosamine 2-epimerase [Proteobacteria bacterium]|nr:N-acylglucosamine 2-epimerase [Pseudomonadota bacterium]